MALRPEKFPGLSRNGPLVCSSEHVFCMHLCSPKFGYIGCFGQPARTSSPSMFFSLSIETKYVVSVSYKLSCCS